jgi:hypothetical protein
MMKRKKKDKKYLEQIDLKGVLEQRVRFEKRIIELGGKIPKLWPGPDRSGALRNLQLLERVEELERKHKNTNTTSNAGGHDGLKPDVTVQAGPMRAEVHVTFGSREGLEAACPPSPRQRGRPPGVHYGSIM